MLPNSTLFKCGFDGSLDGWPLVINGFSNSLVNKEMIFHVRYKFI